MPLHDSAPCGVLDVRLEGLALVLLAGHVERRNLSGVREQPHGLMLGTAALVDAVGARFSQCSASDEEASSRLIPGAQMLCCGEDNSARVGQIAHPGGLTMREIARPGRLGISREAGGVRVGVRTCRMTGWQHGTTSNLTNPA
jgi:hypothetical protein